MASKARRKDESLHWTEHSLHKLQADRALWALAEMEMQGWCSKFGGVPDDPVTLIELRCSLEPAATELLTQLLAMSADDRRAVANRLWPVSSRRSEP